MLPGEERREVMNELNYASLEASKRLVDAGIVLVTDVQWIYRVKKGVWGGGHYELYTGIDTPSIPAPSMAEVWRELPEGTIFMKANGKIHCSFGDKGVLHSSNPADALIDLLIWVKGESKGER